LSAAFTRAAVNGSRRSRTPVASKIALPTAAGIAVMAFSPEPIAGSFGRLMSAIFTSGISMNRNTWYVSQFVEPDLFGFSSTSSLSARLTPWTTLPSIWALMPFGLMMIPVSWYCIAAMPRPVATSPFAFAFGDGRACQPAALAATSITARSRGSPT
jgi:hypothetical protein